MRTKLGKVFRKAAERIASKRANYSCLAVQSEVNRDTRAMEYYQDNPVVKAYISAMGFEGINAGYRFTEMVRLAEKDDPALGPEHRNLRLLMLGFAEAMADTGDIHVEA